MFGWGVRYDAPAPGDGKGKVTWQVGEDWRPDAEIIKAFEDLVGGDGENMEWGAFEFVGEREEDPEVYIYRTAAVFQPPGWRRRYMDSSYITEIIRIKHH
jgi:hypothetical protein